MRPGAVIKLDSLISDMVLLSLVAWRMVHPAVTHTWVACLLNECVAAARDRFLLWQESFVRAKNWVKELQRQASPNIVIALAGNKADLANKRALDFQVGCPPDCRRSSPSNCGFFSLTSPPLIGCPVIRR